MAEPPFASANARRFWPSRSEIMPAGQRHRPRQRVRLAGAVVDHDQPGRAGERRALDLRDQRAVAAQDERDLALERAVRQRAERVVRVVGGSAQVRVDGLVVGSRGPSRRRRRSGRASTRRAGSRAPPADWMGTAPSEGGPPVTLSAGAKTFGFDVAATVIASGAVPGEPAVPSPKSSRSLPAAITGTTPGQHRVVHGDVHRVVRRIGLRAAAREVDDVHPVGDRRLERLDDLRACSPRRRAESGR